MTSYFCCRKTKKNFEYENIGEPYSVESSLVSSIAAGNKKITTDDLNLWSNPHDLTHTESGDDEELVALLEKRDNAASAITYQMASDQVERIRSNRRKVQDRWKRVLRELGFDDERELSRLVTVTPLSQDAAGTSHFSMQAENLHSALARDTMIFGNGSTQRDRYATVLSRLIDLDTGDDFVAKAKELYPRLEPDGMSDLEWDQHPSNFRLDQNHHTDHKTDQIHYHQDQLNVNQNHRVHYDKDDNLQIVFDSNSNGIDRE